MLQLIQTILMFFSKIMASITFSIDYFLEWQHLYITIYQAPKLLKDQIKINLIVHKGGYNLRNKFQVNQPLRIYNHYSESKFVYFYSKFINNFILNDLKVNFYTFKKVLYNNLNNRFVKFCQIFPKFNLWLKN